MSWLSSRMEQKVRLICSYLCPGVSVEITPLDPGGSIHTHVGGTVSLNCRVEGGEAEEHLEEEMEWHRDGQLVKLDPHNHFSPSRLCLQNITVDDHQVTYTCHLKRNPTIAASAQIKVHCESESTLRVLMRLR